MQLGCEGLAALRRRHGRTLINGVVAFEGYDPQGLAPPPRVPVLLLAHCFHPVGALLKLSLVLPHVVLK